jgi:hypothetical protein
MDGLWTEACMQNTNTSDSKMAIDVSGGRPIQTLNNGRMMSATLESKSRILGIQSIPVCRKFLAYRV